MHFSAVNTLVFLTAFSLNLVKPALQQPFEDDQHPEEIYARHHRNNHRHTNDNHPRNAIEIRRDERAEQDEAASSTELVAPVICGQYGFRCIDDRYFQVCSLADLDGNLEEPNVVHECAEDLECDEDNNAFCSPRFKYMEVAPPKAQSSGCEGKFKRQENQLNSQQLQQQQQSRVVNATGAKEAFRCDSFGMFPDANNASMFWFCDRGCHENSFNIRHMMCAQERVFDAKRNECIEPVAIATAPNSAQRFASESVSRATRQRIAELRDAVIPSTTPFTCSDRAMGKYADPENCQKYHLCLPEKGGTRGFNEVIFVCPAGMAYDPKREQCDRAAIGRCVQKETKVKKKKKKKKKKGNAKPKPNKHRENVHDDDDEDDEEEDEDDDNEDDAPDDDEDESDDDDEDDDDDVNDVEHSDGKKKGGKCNCETGTRSKDNDSCAGYRLCIGQVRIQMQCPKGERFNNTLLLCQPANLVNCSP